MSSKTCSYCELDRTIETQVCDTAKPKMIGAGRDLALASRTDDVAGAVLISAEKRSTTLNSLRLIWFGGIERGIWSSRIACHPISCRQLLVIVRAVPVARPLPDIPRHVVESVLIRWILGYWGNANESIFARITHWKVTLVSVRHPIVFWTKLIAPHKGLSCPLRVGLGVGVRDVHDWIVIFAFDIALWSERMVPVRTPHVIPPSELVVQRNGMVGGRKHYRSRKQILLWCAREFLCRRSALRNRYVTCRFHELSKLSIRYVRPVHKEAIDVHAMNRTRIQSGFHADVIHVGRIIGAHRELSTWNPHHSIRSFLRSGYRVGHGWLKS